MPMLFPVKEQELRDPPGKRLVLEDSRLGRVCLVTHLKTPFEYM